LSSKDDGKEISFSSKVIERRSRTRRRIVSSSFEISKEISFLSSKDDEKEISFSSKVIEEKDYLLVLRGEGEPVRDTRGNLRRC
jgi:hypothetical protein